MKITLSPVCVSERKHAISIEVINTSIILDGQVIDMSVIPEGGQAEASADSPFLGVVTRESVVIKYPYSTDIYEQNQSTNTEDYEFYIKRGSLPCPLTKRR